MATKIRKVYSVRIKAWDEDWIGLWKNFKEVEYYAEDMARSDWIRYGRNMHDIEYGRITAFLLTNEEYEKLYYDGKTIEIKDGWHTWYLDDTNCVIFYINDHIIACPTEENEWTTQIITVQEAQEMAEGRID